MDEQDPRLAEPIAAQGNKQSVSSAQNVLANGGENQRRGEGHAALIATAPCAG